MIVIFASVITIIALIGWCSAVYKLMEQREYTQRVGQSYQSQIQRLREQLDENQPHLEELERLQVAKTTWQGQLQLAQEQLRKQQIVTDRQAEVITELERQLAELEQVREKIKDQLIRFAGTI